MSKLRAAKAKIRLWRENPVQFVRDVFGVEPDPFQADALAAFPTHNRIAGKACKGPGKTALEAWLGWNFLLTRPHPKVPCTSISGDNLRDGLWTEFAKWQARSPLLQEAFVWQAERIFAKDHPETWFATARQWSKSADPSQLALTLAGIHGDYVLFLVDEAGGIPTAVIATAEAALSTGTETKLVIMGNPTQPSGPLYDACTKDRALWFVVEVTGDPDDPKRSPRIGLQWAREQIQKYGRESPYVLVNVFGRFPPGASNALLGIDEVTAASRRAVTHAEYIYAPKVMGVDVARFGDDRSTIHLRQGKVAFMPRDLRNLDTMALAGQVALSIEKHGPDAVFVDEGGIGAGVVDRLRQLGHQVLGVQFGARALRPQPKLADRRTEMWWSMAEWVQAGGCIPDKPELISDLTAPTYFFLADGRIRLESKEDLKARGLPSPDDGDGLALTFAEPVASRALSIAHGMPSQKPGRVVCEYEPFEQGRT